MPRTISQCEICADLADAAFESNPAESDGVALRFLVHVLQSHTEELLTLLAEKYIPIFLTKRALR